MWFISEPLTVEEARAELQRAAKDMDHYNKKGQIEIFDFNQWYATTGKFDADKVLRGWVDKEQQARKNGFEGLRLGGDTFWIEHEEWKSLSDYEATVNNVIHNYHMLAICSYPLDKCDAHEILDVFGTHQFALIVRNGKWAIIEGTERKRAEEAVATERKRFYDILEGLPCIVVLMRPDHHVVFANRFRRESFGEPHGRRCYELAVGGTEPCKNCKSYTVLKTKAPIRWEWTGPDGRILDVSAFPFADPDGSPLVLEMSIDITARKRAEEGLQRSFYQLRALTARLQSIREEERKRVARDIHDQLGQALTALRINLSALIRDLPKDKKQGSESVMNLIDQTIQSVRRISTELRPGVLDDLGLVAAIEWAGEEFEARTKTKCRLDLPQEDVSIDQEHATALFRILQETLTNVVRHASASQVNVRLTQEDGRLILEIRDNGKGVSEEQLSAAGALGILGMRERALLLGGELIISGAPGQGTVVRVEIPEARQNQPE
jgi:signal transduction histidine kinase